MTIAEPMTFMDTMENDQQDIVNALAASPQFAQDGVCFAARNSGLYRTRDGGHSWHSALDSLNLEAPLAVSAVAVSPNFAADRTVFAGAHGGVLASTDAGETWQVVMLPEPSPLVTSLAISPNYAVDGTVFAGTLEDGMFRSADRGQTWAAWNFGLLDPNVLVVAIATDFADTSTVYAGTGSGLFRSTNGGHSWRDVELPAEYPVVLALAAGAGGTLFVGTEEDGLYAMLGNGVWERRGALELTSEINGLVLDRSSSALLAQLSDTLFISRDAGATWSEWSEKAHFPQGIGSVAAPSGLHVNAPLLIGTIDGDVARL